MTPCEENNYRIIDNWEHDLWVSGKVTYVWMQNQSNMPMFCWKSFLSKLGDIQRIPDPLKTTREISAIYQKYINNISGPDVNISWNISGLAALARQVASTTNYPPPNLHESSQILNEILADFKQRKILAGFKERTSQIFHLIPYKSFALTLPFLVQQSSKIFGLMALGGENGVGRILNFWSNSIS